MNSHQIYTHVTFGLTKIYLFLAILKQRLDSDHTTSSFPTSVKSILILTFSFLYLKINPIMTKVAKTHPMDNPQSTAL